MQELQESPKVEGKPYIYAHGEKEIAAVAKTQKNGIPVNDDTMVEFLDLCNYLGLDFAEYFGSYTPPANDAVFKGNY